MPWTGSPGSKLYTRTDGTRSGSQVWQQASAAAVDIIPTDHDVHDQDLADAISSCLMKDGGNSATSNISMGGFRLTNVGTAIARTDAIRAGDVQDNRMSYCSVSGTANAITLTNTVPITSYSAGQEFRFTAALTNSGPVTVAVDGLAAKSVTVAGVPLTAGQIVAGAWITIAYNGTNFELAVGTAPASVSVGSVMAWPLSSVPSGWLECDGSAISRTTYSALFAVIGTTYGSGDGSTTFNLPNYKDYFLRGYDASGTDASSRTDRGDGTTGANVGTKQADQTKSHNHTFTGTAVPNHDHTIANTDTESTPASNILDSSDNKYLRYEGARGYSTAYTLKGSLLTPTLGVTGAAGGFTPAGSISSTGGTETRPKNVTVKWIILAIPSAALSTAQIAPYFTALTADRSGSDTNSAQAVFGSSEDAITLPAATAYHFKALYYITRSAGTTSHTTSVLFGGTATYTSIMYVIESTTTTGGPTATTNSQQLVATAATATVAATTSTSATENIVIKLEGIMRINASGTVIPQIQYSAAPGGAPTFKANSYFMLTPIGSNTVASVGNWS